MRRFAILLLILPFTVFGQEAEELPYIRNDSFVENAFGFPATVQNFQKHYGSQFKITKTPVRNRHDSTIVDTIYLFSAGKTYIEVYKTKQHSILQAAYIDNDRIPLKYHIKVGDTKGEVAKRLKAVIIDDKVQLGDFEHGQVFTFIFLDGKLSAISYEGYVD